MGFLDKHFGMDFSAATREELEALKKENEARAIESERLNQVEVDHMPVWLNMTNTTRCNLQCIMCNQAYGRIDSRIMKPEIYDTIVRQFYPFLKTVQLTAIGEPLMTPQLLQKVEDMRRFGVKLEMVTNGTLLKGDKLLELLASVSELIIISLDGATPETFNFIRSGADLTEIVDHVERFNHFRAMHPAENCTRLIFNYILMKRNIRELPDFVDLAADLGAEEIICSHLVLYERGLEDEMLLYSPDLSNAFTEAAAKRAKARKIKIRLPPPFEEESPDQRIATGMEAAEGDSAAKSQEPPEPAAKSEPESYEGERCFFLWRRVYIGPDGEVVPCCLSGIEAIGNLNDQPFIEIWNNAKYRSFRRRVHTSRPLAPCRNCYLINRNPSRADFKKI